VTKLAFALTALALATTQPASAAPPVFAETLTFDGVEFSRQGTGELKARALLTAVTICEFGKYQARENTQQPGPHLLVLRFARKLSADQVQQVFRGVVETQSGYSDAELKGFLQLLPAVKADSVVHFRADTAGGLTVFAANKPLGSLVAPKLAAALWAGLGTDN